MVGIYKITSNDTGKCYIGQSIDISTRWQQHMYKALYRNDNNKFYNAVRKYGINNFTFEVIELCEKNQTILDERERYWIEYYDSYNNGYNSTKGGRTQSWTYNPETIKKMWDDGFTTGKIKEILGCSSSLINERLQGYHDFNNSTSHQRSCGFHRELPLSQKQLQYFGKATEVHQYSLFGEYIASYPTIDAAAQALNVKYPQAIGRCLREKEKNYTAYGYQWSKEKVDKMPMAPHPRGKIVHCITTDMYFLSAPEAAKWANLKSSSNITDCCNGKVKSAGKHPITGEKLQWEYIE